LVGFFLKETLYYKRSWRNVGRVPNRPLFQKTVLYFNRPFFIFIEPIKDAKCPLFSRFW
jgi:hypothetical protein